MLNDVQQFRDQRIISRPVPCRYSPTTWQVYKRYLGWCKDEDKTPLGFAKFGRCLTELGVKKTRVRGDTRYLDIVVRFNNHPKS
jgi:hypothetical protein